MSFLGLFLGGVLAGTPIIEAVFNYPGIGAIFLHAVNFLDYSVIMGTTMIVVLLALFANLLIDIAYVWVDSRIKF